MIDCQLGIWWVRTVESSLSQDDTEAVISATLALFEEAIDAAPCIDLVWGLMKLLQPQFELTE
jgi:hypothetical protein